MTVLDPKPKYTTDRYQKGGLHRSASEPVIHGRWAIIHSIIVDDEIFLTIIEGVLR